MLRTGAEHIITNDLAEIIEDEEEEDEVQTLRRQRTTPATLATAKPITPGSGIVVIMIAP